MKTLILFFPAGTLLYHLVSQLTSLDHPPEWEDLDCVFTVLLWFSTFVILYLLVGILFSGKSFLFLYLFTVSVLQGAE